MQNQHELEFGLTVPQGWRGGDLELEEENDPVKQYEFSKSISVTADSIGFDSIYAYDHFIPFYSDDRNKNIFECFTLLSSLAAITERIKIGQIVTCNSYRNPSLVAKNKKLEESVSIIKAMWKEEHTSFEGKYYSIKEAICNPKPIQKPHPIIM